MVGAHDLSKHRQIHADEDGAKIADLGAFSEPEQRNCQLYTAQQRVRRDESRWTLVQGILAPVQFIIFGISLYLVINYLRTGQGENAANLSILIKTAALYTIMITGSIWEKVVFDAWLFAKSFFWEDMFSMVVLALHTAYLVMLFNDVGSAQERMYVALAGYAAYVINAGQFLYKLRVARLESAPQSRQLVSAL